MLKISKILYSKKSLIKKLSLVYLLFGFSWLIAPLVNHRLAVGPSLISEYEGPGMPYANWLKLFDACSSLALILAVWLYRKHIVRRFHIVIMRLSLFVGVMAFVDIVTAPKCSLSNGVCSPEYGLVLYLHFVETLLMALAMLIIGVYAVKIDRKWLWGPILQIILGIAGIVSIQYFDHTLFALQAVTVMVQSYWLWCLLFSNLFKTDNPPDIGFVRRSLAVLIALVGILSVVGASRFMKGGSSFSFWLGPASAWLSQHNIVTGFAFLYLARQIYQGERNAYRLSLWLVLMQVVKYSTIEPRLMPLLAYSFVLTILIFSKNYFVRLSGHRHFLLRLKSVAVALGASLVVITVIGSVFRLKEPEIWEHSTFTASRVIMRATLLEVSTNPNDPLRARLFGQILNAAGIAMYAWILFGLFSPEKHGMGLANDEEKDRMRSLLNEYGRNSEDSFKLWPEDKRYWFSPNDSAAIAFKTYKGFVIALDSPVGGNSARRKAAISFKNFCRQQGWKLVWLMAEQSESEKYEKEGMKTLKIGASAVVDLKKYTEDTVGNKWWRWIRNKNRKLGLNYELLASDIDATTMRQLRLVSDKWLEKDGRSERSFALGYFDERFMRKCRVHVLRDASGEIVAFANQLPQYHNNRQSTIDMMRSLPEYDGAITYLLSEALINMYGKGHFQTFDLGFVPLAQTENAPAKKLVLTLSTSLLDAFFSARGLRQFKNKFEPTWHDNFLAWDGDWLDLPSIAQAIDKVLAYPDQNS